MRMLRTLGVVLAFVALAAGVRAADNWVPLAGISATTSLVTNSLCYTDGTDLVCDGTAGTVGGGASVSVTTGASGSLVYRDAYGSLVASSTLSISSTTGSVGIGAGAPSWMTNGLYATGYIASALGFSAPYLNFGSGTTRIGGSTGSNNDNMNFNISGTEAIRIVSTGYVGIGTSSPTSRLDVNGSLSVGGTSVALKRPSDGAYPLVLMSNSTNSSTLYITGFNSGLAPSGSNVPMLSYRTTGGTILQTLFAVPANNSPLVGIGINEIVPSTTLQVSGTIRMSDGAEACDANRTGAIKYTGGDFYVCRNGSSWESLTSIGGGGSGDAITSGTTKVTANSTGYVSLTTGGTTTGYMDTAGRLIVPGVSVTAGYGISSTQGYFNTSASGGYVTMDSGTTVRFNSNVGGVWGSIQQVGSARLAFQMGGSNIVEVRQSGLYIANNGSLIDAWGNPYLTMRGGGTSNINGFTINNAVTGANPTLGVSGTDTDIGLTLSAKGAGSVYVSSSSVGIGTAYPSTTLHVMGTTGIRIGAAGTPAKLALIDNGGVNWAMQPSSTAQFVFANNGGSSYYYSFYNSLNSSMRMGVNTALSPSATLDVSGTVKMGNSGEACDSNRLGAMKYTGGDFYVCRNGSSWESLTSIGGGGSGDAITSGTTKVTANSTGYVSLTTGGTTTGYMDTAGRLIVPGVSVTSAYGISSTNGYFAGSIGIGTTVPSYPLQVSGSAYVDTRMGIGASPNASYALYVGGDAYSTGTWGTSDIRYKENVKTLGGLLARVDELRPVTFTWKKDSPAGKNGDTGEQIGVIAQEVEAVFPDLVKTDAKGYKAVAYDKLSVVLLGAVKELSAENAALKAQNADFERRLERLERRNEVAR